MLLFFQQPFLILKWKIKSPKKKSAPSQKTLKKKPRRPRDAEDVVELPTPRKNIDKALSKSIGQRAADVTQPADQGTLGRKSLNANDPGFLDAPAVAGGKRQGGNRAVKSAEKEIVKLEKKIDTLAKQSTAANKLKGSDRIKKIMQIKSERESAKEQIGLLKTRIKDLKKRYAIEKKAHGGMVQGMRKGHNDMRKAGMFYGGGMVKKKKWHHRLSSFQTQYYYGQGLRLAQSLLWLLRNGQSPLLKGFGLCQTSPLIKVTLYL